MLHCKKYVSFETKFMDALGKLGVNDFDKGVIVDRFIGTVNRTENKHFAIMVLYIFLTNLITVGGVFIVSLLAVSKITITDSAISWILFWICLGLSIAVTIANKYLYSFNVSKKYIMEGVILEKYYSEGWKFIEGVDKYQGAANIHDRVTIFCGRVEDIIRSSVEVLSNISAAVDLETKAPDQTLPVPAPTLAADITEILDTGPPPNA